MIDDTVPIPPQTATIEESIPLPTIEELFFQRLDIISPDLRIYPLEAPEGVRFPVLVYQSITNRPTRDLSGTDGTADIMMQVDVYSEDYAEAKAIGRYVVWLMDTWTDVQSAAVTSIRDGLDKSGETRLYRQTLEIIVFA